MWDTNWISAISTIILVLITAYYAFHTHSMSKTTKKMFDAERRPYLGFDSISCSLYKDDEGHVGVTIGIIYKNLGKVLLKYEVDQIIVSINNVTLHEPEFNNKGHYIYPGQQCTFTYNTIQINAPSFPLTGLVEYRLRYFSNESDVVYKSYKKLKLVIDKERFQWFFLEELEE